MTKFRKSCCHVWGVGGRTLETADCQAQCASLSLTADGQTPRYTNATGSHTRARGLRATHWTVYCLLRGQHTHTRLQHVSAMYSRSTAWPCVHASAACVRARRQPVTAGKTSAPPITRTLSASNDASKRHKQGAPTPATQPTPYPPQPWRGTRGQEASAQNLPRW